MTVAALVSSIDYLENGVTLAFAAPFRFLPGTLQASRVLANGTVVQLTPGVDFSVTGGATDAGGTLTLGASVAGATLRIRRRTARAQGMDYTPGDRFPAESHEQVVDRAMLIDQEQDDAIGAVKRRALMVPDGETAVAIPAAEVRMGQFLAFDSMGRPIAASGTGADAALRPDLATDFGAAMVGSTGGVSVQDMLDNFAAAVRMEADHTKILVAGIDKNYRFTNMGLFLGTPTGASRLVIKTDPGEQVRGLDIYQHADQLAPSNQYPSLTLHTYVHGYGFIADQVGHGTIAILRNAHNPGARPDMPNTFVGDADYLDIQRSRVSGAGNLGTGNDRLALIDKQGLYRAYGSDGADWNGAASTAPFQSGSYTGFFTKSAYWGWDQVHGEAIYGAIEDGAAFQPLKLACSEIRVLGDGVVNLAKASNRLDTIFAATGTINTSDEREKIWRGPLNAAELRAATRIVDELGFYQWAHKGAKGRIHFGARAQQVWRIMAEEELVDPIGGSADNPIIGATPYAFLCFDAWDEESDPAFEMRDVEVEIMVARPTRIIDPRTGQPVMRTRREKGIVSQKFETDDPPTIVRAGGNRFGLRIDELSLFIIAAQAAMIAAQNMRLSALEARLSALEAA